jgi:ferredoxin
VLEQEREEGNNFMEIKIDYGECCWKDGKCLNCSCGGACVEACKHGALSLE